MIIKNNSSLIGAEIHKGYIISLKFIDVYNYAFSTVPVTSLIVLYGGDYTVNRGFYVEN